MAYIFVTDVKFAVVKPIPKKQFRPKLVNTRGLIRKSVTLVKALHPENAVLPILITLIGIITEVNVIQFRNALVPMLVTVLGISGIMPVILTIELKPVIDVLLVGLSKIKKASPAALFKIAVEIPEVVS
jgi:hypothetical protein